MKIPIAQLLPQKLYRFPLILGHPIPLKPCTVVPGFDPFVEELPDLGLLCYMIQLP